mgnify:CR=1 FL=1|tara:strand:- start:497 stop:613 length:117 start_codon:yes stop_codon:yes gene_type:complete
MTPLGLPHHGADINTQGPGGRSFAAVAAHGIFYQAAAM